MLIKGGPGEVYKQKITIPLHLGSNGIPSGIERNNVYDK